VIVVRANGLIRPDSEQTRSFERDLTPLLIDDPLGTSFRPAQKSHCSCVIAKL
jgi:hypothetical protein